MPQRLLQRLASSVRRLYVPKPPRSGKQLMNRVRHLTSLKNLNSKEFTVEIRSTKLTQEGSVKGCSPKQASCEIANRHASCRALWLHHLLSIFPPHPAPSQRLYEDISCPFIPFDMARGQAKSNIKNVGALANRTPL